MGWFGLVGLGMVGLGWLGLIGWVGFSWVWLVGWVRFSCVWLVGFGWLDDLMTETMGRGPFSRLGGDNCPGRSLKDNCGCGGCS